MEEPLRSQSSDDAIFRASRLLRFGIASVLWYAAYRGFVDPNAWVGFIPVWVSSYADQFLVLKIFEVLQLVLGAWILIGIRLRIASLVATAFFIGIIVSNVGAFDIVFRDVTMIFAALALFVLAGYSPEQSAIRDGEKGVRNLFHSSRYREDIYPFLIMNNLVKKSRP